MKYWNQYEYHNPVIIGKKKKIDSTIYSFDIETSSYLILNNRQVPAIKYLDLSEDERVESKYCSCMYIWMFSVNDIVYYGRTWEELKEFIKLLDKYIPYKKIIFIHNLAFEFQYLKSVFKMKNVLARKSHKVMRCELEDYKVEFRCSYMMSNCALKYLPSLFNLPVEKQVGDLDYTLIRTPITTLSDKELKYCENDCLVIYHYIKMELETYENIDKIPLTSTGHVRRELKSLVLKDFKYRRLVGKAINTDPHIYNLLIQAFMGGYTHSNWIYTDEILENIDSWDFTSSYPYILVTHKFPSSEFKPCQIRSVEEMSQRLAYLIVVRFKNLKCKYYNNFISQSKCRDIHKGKYDNGRVMEAESLEMTLTDVDFRFILESYNCEYEILECYYSTYNYLPKMFIDFVLDKYVKKTEYKNVMGKEVEYSKEKNKFNSLYGMSVTNMIKDEVSFDNDTGWSERKLENNEIIDLLEIEKKKSFLSFAYGVWVTAYARNNLLKNICKLDEYVVYADTDSIKLLPGYDKKVIDDYNLFVENKIKYVSNLLGIPYERYSPKDIYGEEHLLGVFDSDGHYEKFITQGAKKYCYIKKYKKSKIENKKDNYNIVDEDNDYYYVIEITLAGTPKSGAKALKSIEEFRDDFVFDFKYTNKNLLMYVDSQEEFNLVDYKGEEYKVSDKTGCCILPTTYVLGKSLEYASLIDDNSSKRAIYEESDGDI